jgi:hypothetical protein
VLVLVTVTTPTATSVELVYVTANEGDGASAWLTPTVAAVAVDATFVLADHHAEAVAVPATSAKTTHADTMPAAIFGRVDRRITAAPDSL